MADEARIRSLVKEADLYRSQGLTAESKQKYLEALQLIRKGPKLDSYQRLEEEVKGKIQALEKEMAAIGQKSQTRMLSQEEQDLIKKSFSFSKNKAAATIEGAVALAKFGQYQVALREFRGLLKQGALSLVAAKNIIRCHFALLSPDTAIDEFGQWISGDLLSRQQLKEVREFLEKALEKRGIERKVPEVVETPLEKPAAQAEPEDIIDICSVRLRLADGPGKGEMLEFDVSFQSGNTISFIVSGAQKDLLDTLSAGIRLPDMEFYSPIAVFRGDGVVSGKTKIRSGPRKGSYMLDIKIESV